MRGLFALLSLFRRLLGPERVAVAATSGREIIALRRLARVSRRKLAELTGIDNDTLRRMEAGREDTQTAVRMSRIRAALRPIAARRVLSLNGAKRSDLLLPEHALLLGAWRADRTILEGKQG